MDRNVGFYDPAEKVRDDKGQSEIDYAELFAIISNKTGWTPQQIASLSRKQFKHYINAWWGSKEKSETITNPNFDEIQAFNLSAGIERILKKT